MDKNMVIHKLLEVIALAQKYPIDDEDLLKMITDITNKIEIKLLNNIVELLKVAHQENI
jgi:hypothetical protein